nr:hypothetical protein [uncultured Acetatifactor sp.]
MDEDGLRDLLSKRLYIELGLFKDSMLQKGKEDIFRSSYEIEVYVNLHESYMGLIDNLDGNAMRRLLGLPFGMLGHAYEAWMMREDSFYGELRECAQDELEALSAMGDPDYEEEEDGTGADKAA